jgi:hypothetical protein
MEIAESLTTESTIWNICMLVSGVTYVAPLIQMHCDGLGVSNPLIRNKLQASKEKEKTMEQNGTD